MKTLLPCSSALAVLTLLSSAALAGDIGLAPASYDWSGGYIGANAGAGINNTEFQTSYRYTGSDDPGDETRDLIRSLNYSTNPGDLGFTAGMVAGYNWQMSSFVVGVEGDFNYLGFTGTERNNVSDVMSQVLAPENTSATDKISYDTTWFGTLRGRLGYAAGNILLYGTGGLAYGQMKVSQQLNASNDDEYARWGADVDSWRFGWTAGGGMEYGVDRWTLGLEYLYVDLGSFDWSSPGTVSLTDDTLNTDWSQVKEKGSADFRFGVARATMKYRF